MRTRTTLLVLLVAACRHGEDVPPELEENLAACEFSRGTLPADSLGTLPAIPIDHFVIVMQENRSFDHYFSSLTVPGQTVDGAPATLTNPNPQDGGLVSRFHQTSLCFDNPAEEWDDIHYDYDDGALDGFTKRNALDDANDPTGARALGYFDEHELPYYYALARAFAISDRHFSSVMTNTFTNRLFFMAGTAFGQISNEYPMHSNPNLFTRLNDAQVSWTVYSQDFPTPALLGDTFASNLSRFTGFEQFFADLNAGTLASVVIVEGSDGQGGASPNEDPPADPQPGQAMVARIVAALMRSPQWSSSALLLTYDEPGGLYDHVPPPRACAPDDTDPRIPDGGFIAGYTQYGLRVPLLIVSPFAKRGYVSHHVTDHTSLLRLIEARFNLPALTRRDANAVPPFDMFDFTHADTSVPQLPEAQVDDAGYRACIARYPPK
jgi:phospholipase C